MPDHLKYNLDGSRKTQTPTLPHKRPLTELFTEYLTVRMWLNQHDGQLGFSDPIEHVRAYRHTDRKGVEHIHLHHRGLGPLASKSEIIEANGTIKIIVRVTKIAGEWLIETV
jgi:hypothetical protein